MKTTDEAVGVVDEQSCSGGEWLTELEMWGTLAASTTNSLTDRYQQRTYTPTAQDTNIQYDWLEQLSCLSLNHHGRELQRPRGSLGFCNLCRGVCLHYLILRQRS